MLRNLAYLSLVLGALTLGGCATPFGTVTSPAPGTVVVTPAPGVATPSPVIGQVQDAAAKICAFVPTASTVASIVTTFTGGGAIADLVGNVANSICASLTKKTLSRGNTLVQPSVNGVPIYGYYLR